MEAASVILSGVLVLLTGAYAWLTWVMVQRSSQSTEAARVAAIASQAAAEASRRSAEVAEATLPLRFKLRVDRHADGDVWLTVKVRGASIWLHAARLTDGVIRFDPDGPGGRRIAPVDLIRPGAGNEFPFFATRGGGGHSLEWPHSPLRVTDWGCGASVELDYSISRDSPVLTRRVSVELPFDFYHQVNQRLGFMVDYLPDAGEIEQDSDGSN